MFPAVDLANEDQSSTSALYPAGGTLGLPRHHQCRLSLPLPTYSSLRLQARDTALNCSCGNYTQHLDSSGRREQQHPSRLSMLEQQQHQAKSERACCSRKENPSRHDSEDSKDAPAEGRTHSARLAVIRPYGRPIVNRSNF